MEKHLKRHINNNLWELVTLTSCNTTCIVNLQAKNVLSIEDVAKLEAIPNELKKTRKLYEILFTKKGCYPHLIAALEKGCQSGAVEILSNWKDSEDAPCLDESGSSSSPKRRKTERDPIRFEVLAPVPLFTGRESQLEELHGKLQETLEKRAVISQSASIVGLGGIGKTELARKYIEKYGDQFYNGNGIWMSAETEESLSTSFRRLALDHLNWSLSNADKGEINIITMVDRIYCHFGEQRVLFVFDNAESSEYLNKFMPSRLSSSSTSFLHILITSRDREWSFSVQVLELGEMTEEDAVCFVKRSLMIQDDDDGSVLKLVNRLQRFPLALSQAVSFIQQRRVLGEFTISQYLERFEANCEKLLGSKKPEMNSYRETTLSTWRVTTQQISEDKGSGRYAMEILNSISYLLPDKIPMRIFSNVEYEEGLLLLVKYSMVNVQREEKTLSVHRLVQDVSRIQLTMDKGVEEYALKIILELILSSNLGEDLVYHAISAFKFSCALTPNLSREFKKLPWKILEVLNENVRYREAQTVGKELGVLLNQLVPEEEPELCRLEYRIAVSAFHLKENVVGGFFGLEKIFPYFFENKDSFSQLEVLAAERLMANYFQELEMYEDAVEFSRYTFERQKTLHGLDEWHTIDSLVNLANAEWNWKKYLASGDVNEEELRLAEESRKEELSNTRFVLEEAYAAHLELIGKDVNWTNTVVKIAKCLIEMGATESAIKIIGEVIHRGAESCEKRILENVISCLKLMCLFKEKEEKSEEMLVLYQNIYSKLVELKGESDPETTEAEAKLYMKFWEMGELEAALEVCKHLLKVLEKGQPHPSLVYLNLTIAEILTQLGRVEEGVEVLERTTVPPP